MFKWFPFRRILVECTISKEFLFTYSIDVIGFLGIAHALYPNLDYDLNHIRSVNVVLLFRTQFVEKDGLVKVDSEHFSFRLGQRKIDFDPNVSISHSGKVVFALIDVVFFFRSLGWQLELWLKCTRPKNQEKPNELGRRRSSILWSEANPMNMAYHKTALHETTWISAYNRVF